MDEFDPRRAAIEELAEEIACKQCGRLFKRCGPVLFQTENDYELPDLKNHLKSTILEMLLDSRMQLAEDVHMFEIWQSKQPKPTKGGKI